MPLKVFFLEPTDQERRSLRRYADSGVGEPCPKHGYHNAMVKIGIATITNTVLSLQAAEARRLDQRWPTHCDCGYEFKDADHWQDFRDRLYKRQDTGELVALRDHVPGACWDAEWMHRTPSMCGPDGRSLHVICPDGREWCIDGPASNCTMPEDKVHKCWVRHGRPEDGTLHVDKDGVTCAAGAGSIDTGTYHGFLHHGEFT